MLKEIYINRAVKDLRESFSYSNVMQVPKVSKVCLNVSVGTSMGDDKVATAILRDFALIAAQKPVLVRAKKSVAGFKVRAGMATGCSVTIRGQRMYEFLERLVYIALPRERDFKGFSLSQFDGNGNLSFGIREYLSFIEVDYDKMASMWGMDVSIVTTAKTDKEGYVLLKALSFPFFN